MQNIFIEQEYKFIPPIHWPFLTRWINRSGFFPWYLKRTAGVVQCEVTNESRLTDSLRAGHGVLVTPNHPSTLDPLAMSYLSRKIDSCFYAMASWHLFHTSRFERWAVRLMGAFSVFREGLDRQAIDMAVRVLTEASRPLCIFPEGTATRTNDRLSEMLDGVSFIARTAAKKRAKDDPSKRVVVHPVAIKYLYLGKLEKEPQQLLEQIEKRLTFRPLEGVSYVERLRRVGEALLSLKEIEYFGEVRGGEIADRQNALVERLMAPLEEEWLGKVQTGGIVGRVKNVRMKVFPDIAKGAVDSQERARRYRHLADTYLAQQIAFYPIGYFEEGVTHERIVETIERFEEDITDEAPTLGPLKVIIDVLPAIEVEPQRDRHAESDALMEQIKHALTSRLNELALLGTPYQFMPDGSSPA
ncbi:MAG: 1-acyl-sn-glycerol-3-phosphate acyltransferase [Planctomycetales bacterium]|nr:1-acyl-sn-glycerol-3-phosphate acyltransferase [Planctomycetales bacterium]